MKELFLSTTKISASSKSNETNTVGEDAAVRSSRSIAREGELVCLPN